ncbi:polysaccharide biosynthesis/export family protein [Mesorhizobium sp.]|uniref:polysaccharide biosynthesis/export family protein n=1 Tax=Mesorhizobium sp. TaxID=1871066 RepID=UPI000FE47BEA|nr:polysaccharide biosynthesis/export family protein [Mesorhizobium sp.]RWA60911.1 MAG: hypothetical protein EOQ27_20320 [Mesorhizobium sp.]
MDPIQRPKADHGPAFPEGDRQVSTMATSSHGSRKRSRGAAMSLIPLCLILLCSAPARGQSGTDDRLGPQDTVEVNVAGWGVFRAGVAGAELNGAFTIDAAGTLHLPVIGQVVAAGLRENDLAKLIDDRLQARSGFDVRPVTTVQRRRSRAAAPVDLEAAKNRSLQETNAPARTGQAAQAFAGEQHELVARADTGMPARVVADAPVRQGRAFEERQKRAERLAGDLELAQREVESLQEKAVLANRERAAALGAQQAAEASLAAARRALDEERQKVERLQGDLAAAHQSLDAVTARGKLAAAAQAVDIQGRQVAEAAAKRTEEALALEGERADALALDLSAANQDRDAAKEEVARLSAALEQQRETAVGLARDLTAARNRIDVLKARDAPRAQRVEPAPKVRVADGAGPRLAGKRARSVRAPDEHEIRKVAARKSRQPVPVATIPLPAALLPTRAPLGEASGLW